MNIAILTVASLSLFCSASTLVIMAKVAKEMKNTKTKVETDVKEVKTKTNAAIGTLRSALDTLEM